MTDDNDKIHLPQGSINPDDLTTGGRGAGDSGTDTGGLSSDGTELGAVSPGSDEGRTEAVREEQADKGARHNQ